MWAMSIRVSITWCRGQSNGQTCAHPDPWKGSSVVVHVSYHEVTPRLLLTAKEHFCACVVREVALTLRMRNVWSFISYLGRAQPPPIVVL